MKATSADADSAQLLGIPVNKVYRYVWIFASLVGVFSGILLAPRMALLATSMQIGRAHV